MKILSVDDSKAVLSFVKDVFKDSEHEIVTALGGAKALELLESEEGSQIDLVLLDWEMPDPNGPKVLQEICDKKINVKVVMLTSRNSEEDILKMLELGAVEFIMKPFTKDLLISKVEEILGA